MVWPLGVRSICARPWRVAHSGSATRSGRSVPRARTRTFRNKPLTASMVVAVTLSPHAANKSFWSISCVFGGGGEVRSQSARLARAHGVSEMTSLVVGQMYVRLP